MNKGSYVLRLEDSVLKYYSKFEFGDDVEEIFDRIGLREHITSNRRSGMLSMVDKIKFYASQALRV
jgi:hypothetical protein